MKVDSAQAGSIVEATTTASSSDDSVSNVTSNVALSVVDDSWITSGHAAIAIALLSALVRTAVIGTESLTTLSLLDESFGFAFTSSEATVRGTVIDDPLDDLLKIFIFFNNFFVMLS